jgi:hypothetical protein
LGLAIAAPLRTLPSAQGAHARILLDALHECARLVPAYGVVADHDLESLVAFAQNLVQNKPPE